MKNKQMAKYIIFFNQDSNMLQEKAMEKLGDIAAMISEKPEVQLMITGFSGFKRLYYLQNNALGKASKYSQALPSWRRYQSVPKSNKSCRAQRGPSQPRCGS